MRFYDQVFTTLSQREKLSPGSTKNIIASNPVPLEPPSDKQGMFLADKQVMTLLNEANADRTGQKKRDFDRATRKIAYGR